MRAEKLNPRNFLHVIGTSKGAVEYADQRLAELEKTQKVRKLTNLEQDELQLLQDFHKALDNATPE